MKNLFKAMFTLLAVSNMGFMYGDAMMCSAIKDADLYKYNKTDIKNNFNFNMWVDTHFYSLCTDGSYFQGEGKGCSDKCPNGKTLKQVSEQDCQIPSYGVYSVGVKEYRTYTHWACQ